MLGTFAFCMLGTFAFCILHFALKRQALRPAPAQVAGPLDPRWGRAVPRPLQYMFVAFRFPAVMPQLRSITVGNYWFTVHLSPAIQQRTTSYQPQATSHEPSFVVRRSSFVVI